MKKLIFLLLVPALSFADRLGSLLSNADVLLTTQAVSASSALGVNYNGVSVASPTAQINFVGPGVSVTATGSTATVTISSWTGGSTSPGGSNSYVQFNNGGVFGGSATYTTDGSSVTVSTMVAVGKIFSPIISNAPNSFLNFELYNGLFNGTSMRLTDNYINGTILNFAGTTNAQTNIQNTSGMQSGTGTNVGQDQLFLGQTYTGQNNGFTFVGSTNATNTAVFGTSASGGYSVTISTNKYVNFYGSATIVGSGGLGVTYNLNAGSITTPSIVASSVTFSSETVQNITITGTCTGAGCSSGSGGYNVQPATVAFALSQGVTASSMTVSSNTYLSADATFYQNAPIFFGSGLTIAATNQANILQLSTATTGIALMSVSSTPASAPTDYLLNISSSNGQKILTAQNNGTVTMSSNTVMPGATDYANGQFVIGNLYSANFSSFTITASSSSTSTLYANTGLACTITPKSTTSLIKITVMGSGDDSSSAGDSLLTIARGNTNLAIGSVPSFTVISLGLNGGQVPVSMATIDSPATTSPVTYNVQQALQGSGTAVFCPNAVCVILCEELH